MLTAPGVPGDSDTVQEARARSAQRRTSGFTVLDVTQETIAAALAAWAPNAVDGSVLVVRAPGQGRRRARRLRRPADGRAGRARRAMSGELIREATRDGRTVARLRCYDADGATIVDAEVTPPGAAYPVRRGPYRFATAPEAFRFVQEALLALQYLGCRVG